MSRQAPYVAAAVLGVLALVLVYLGLREAAESPPVAPQTTAESAAAPAPRPKRPRKVTLTPPSAPEVAPSAREAPEAEPPVAVAWADLPEPFRQYSDNVVAFALHNVVTQCIHPWMADHQVTEPVETEWETTTGPDGLVQVELLYGDEIAPEVDECLRDLLWEAPWPELPVEGEITRSNTFIIDPPTHVKSPEKRAAERATALEGMRSHADAMRGLYLAEP